MSELINNSKERKSRLKALILKLHNGVSEKEVKYELMQSLSHIPYGEVVEVEQELISEGLPVEEVLRLCDAHSAVLHGNIGASSRKDIPDGHPVDTFLRENEALKSLCNEIKTIIQSIDTNNEDETAKTVLKLRGHYNSLLDVDKHYQRKEYLIFPFLEKQEITGPPKVMWGKHDEIRELVKGSIELLQTPSISSDELIAASEMILQPAVMGVLDMIIKEEEILLPMTLDALTEPDWYEVQKQSLEIGFCLYDPTTFWKPVWAGNNSLQEMNKNGAHIKLPSGGFSVEELLAILNTLPVDMTFVDKDDKVKYFSQGSERIFQRNRAILNRDVRHCHPPASAHIVDKIIDDFKTGKANRAPFWINMKGQMIHIEYFALHGENGNYLGTLEVSHDISNYRALEGEQRILSYSK